MKKDITMKKNTFVRGAFITSLGIILTKILGIIYVIPFYALIGDDGGALYGYAYTIYLFFMSISSAGIPLAISKVVSEYQALGYYNVKKRSFALGKKVSIILGLLGFVILELFAPSFARSVLGDVVGGNSIEDVTLVIRVIATAVLICPLLSIYRGYFEGHRFMSPPSISQVIEQLVRVLIIILGSLVALKVFKLSIPVVVSIALFGATVGAIVSYIYLLYKYLKNKKKFNERIRPVNEPIVTNKKILKKILIYSIPFIMIDLFKTLFNYVDMVSVVKGLVTYASFSAVDAETIYSMLSTWSNKFNMILLAVSTGIIVNLIPNITESLVKNNMEDVNSKINKSLSMLLYFIVPMTFGICFLAKPIWTLFYGISKYGSSVLSYYIFVGFIIALFTTLISILQVLKDYKNVFICLIFGILVKIIFNNSLLHTFIYFGLPPYYGFITATILGYLTSLIICLVILCVKFHVSLESTFKHFIDIVCGSLLMLIVLILIGLVVPVYSSVRLLNILIIIFYSFIGLCIYLVYAWKIKLTKNIFGNSFINSIKKLFLKK